MARLVFVHGAFGGAWNWEFVREPLEAAGHTVETFDLPGGGDDETPVEGVTLESCADRVCAVLAPTAGAGACWSATAWAARSPPRRPRTAPSRVAALIFVAAFMPADGQSLLDLTRLPEGKDDMIQANLVVEGDPPVAVLPDEAAREAIFNCCTIENATVCVARLRSQPVAPFATPRARRRRRAHLDPPLLRADQPRPVDPPCAPAANDPRAPVPEGHRARRRPRSVSLRHRRARRRARRARPSVSRLKRPVRQRPRPRPHARRARSRRSSGFPPRLSSTSVDAIAAPALAACCRGHRLAAQVRVAALCERGRQLGHLHCAPGHLQRHLHGARPWLGIVGAGPPRRQERRISLAVCLRERRDPRAQLARGRERGLRALREAGGHLDERRP